VAIAVAVGAALDEYLGRPAMEIKAKRLLCLSSYTLVSHACLIRMVKTLKMLSRVA